jgi:5-methyltetrahydrofolate--homocysteine methyltransferase
MENNRVIYPETPQMMADKLLLLVSGGANIIGGCCGTTPAHIRALVEAAKKLYA